MDPRRGPPLRRRPSSRLLCFRPPGRASRSDPTEPSSPKVSCMGQVRVNSSRRRRRRGSDSRTSEEPKATVAFRSRSLRRTTDQSWVHLPLGCLCGAMKRFFGVFCGFWRCDGGSWRSRCCCCTCSCEVCGEERSAAGGDGSRGPAPADEKGRGWGLRELELVADKLEKGRLLVERRGGYDDDDNEDCEHKNDDVDDMEECGGEEGRFSTQNAVLLMRCRSDPTESSALATCFAGADAVVGECEDSNAEQDLDVASSEFVVCEEHCIMDPANGGGAEGSFASNAEGGGVKTSVVVGLESVKEPQIEVVYKELELPCGSPGKLADRITQVQDLAERVEKEKEEGGPEKEGKVVEKRGGGSGDKMVARRHSSASKEERELRVSKDLEGSRRHSFSSEKDAFPSRRSASNREGRRSSFSMDKDVVRVPPKAELMKLLQAEKTRDPEKVEAPKTREGSVRREALPDCLLLMMYEPKLSMEVSRETWVCTADFVHWQPRHWKRMAEKGSVENKLETGLEVKGGSVRHCEEEQHHTASEEASSGPLLLTRCKSEPARPWLETASQKGCFWRSRYEPMGAGDFLGILAAKS